MANVVNRWIGAVSWLLLSGCVTVDTVAAQDEWRWSGVARVVAIGDSHGADAAFIRLLTAAKLVNAQVSWSGGSAHLVVVGDAIDRGSGSRAILELLIRLQSEAAQAGGYVHFVLGNHEVMNLAGDLRYVSALEYAAFAETETDEQRDAAWRRYQSLPPTEDQTPTPTRDSFDKKYPTGFFGHRAAYAADGHLGSWLLKQPVMVAVNDTAFVHAGFAGRFADSDAAEVNRRFLKHLRGYTLSQNALIQAGVLYPEDDFYEHPALLGQRLVDGEQLDDQVRIAAKNLVALNQGEFFAPDSVVWYRGNVGCSELIERGRFEAVLSALDVKRLAIGHTPTPNRRILSHFDEKLLMMDTGMLAAAYQGRAAAVIIEGGEINALYVDDEETGIEPLPRRVGARPAMLSDRQLETILRSGTIVNAEQRDDGSRLLRLAAGDGEIQAVFSGSRKKRPKFIPEVAAYRFDRMLGFDLVPVAAVRQFDGGWGSLQLVPADIVSEETRSAQRLGGGGWCPLGDQINAMYLFDALTYNERRTLDSMYYSQNNWQLMSIGHAHTFNTKRGRPPHLLETDIPLAVGVAATLRALNAERLDSRLGDVLDKRRIKALLKRRDMLLM